MNLKDKIMTSINEEIERLQAIEKEYSQIKEKADLWDKIWTTLYIHNPAFVVNVEDTVISEIKRLQNFENTNRHIDNTLAEYQLILKSWQAVWWRLIQHSNNGMVIDKNYITKSAQELVLAEIERLQKVEDNYILASNAQQNSTENHHVACVTQVTGGLEGPCDCKTQKTDETDREWLFKCISTLEECRKTMAYFHLSVESVDEIILKLKNYIILNEEQFNKPRDYGRLLAFADRISGIMWGGECAWDTLDNTEEDGLKTLSKSVSELLKKHHKLLSITDELYSILSTIDNEKDGDTDPDDFEEDTDDEYDEDEDILGQIRARKRPPSHSYSTDDNLKLGGVDD
jgi:hypothetical protein